MALTAHNCGLLENKKNTIEIRSLPFALSFFF